MSSYFFKMKPEKYLANGKFYVWKERFAIVKAKKPIPNYFAIVNDDKEITAIINQSKIKSKDVINIEKNWKILTLDILFPLDVVGVTARVATALAKVNVSIMPIAAFSRDHFLIKEKDLEKAAMALSKIGLKFDKQKDGHRNFK